MTSSTPRAGSFDKSEGQEPNPLTSSITFDRWLLCFPRWICKARSSFAWNLRRSFTAEWCKVSAPSTTFPLPVPHPGCFDGGGPGLSRARLGRLAKKRFLHCTVMALNFLFLGRFPTRDEIGRRPNAWQCGVFDRLRSLLSVCGSSLDLISLAPGRSGPQLGASLFQLEQFCQKLQLCEGGYGPKQSMPVFCFEEDPDLLPVSEFPQLEPYRSLQADRLRLTGTGKWPMADFISGPLWLPFQEPGFLLHGFEIDEGAVPSFELESREENLRLLKVWDAAGLLHLEEEPLVEGHFSRVFNCFKAVDRDRQIGDRRLPNMRERHIDGPSRYLPTGYNLINVSAKRFKECLRGSLTDRRDYYHQAAITDERARTNMLPFRFSLKELEHTSALASWVSRKSAMKKLRGRRARGDGFGLVGCGNSARDVSSLYPCFKTLFQGDHLGVEFALEAHQGLLVSEDLLWGSYRISGNAPFPLTHRYEGLIIDDYFCIGAEPLCAAPQESFAYQNLAKARIAYEKHALAGSPEKDIEAECKFKAAGAEFNSLPGSVRSGYVTIGAPAQKRLAIACLSLRLGRLRYCSSTLASRIAGNWTSVLMYRRCLSSIVDDLFAVGAAAEDESPDVVKPISHKVVEELSLLAIFAPFMVTNAAADYSKKIFATDASLSAGAIVETDADEDLSRLLWLGGDKKGSYTVLDGGFRSALKALGEFYDDGRVEEPLKVSPKKSPLLYFDFIEFYGGAGGISKHLHDMGFSVAPPLDLSKSQHFNMTEVRLLEWALDMLATRRIASFMTEPPCTTFSPAAHPSCRSYAEPLGYNRQEEKVIDGNTHAFRSFVLMNASLDFLIPSGLEQPFLSKMAWTFGWKSLLSRGCKEAYIDSCQFGSPHKKPFRFLCHLLDVDSMTCRCKGGHKHIPIAGALTRPSAVYVDGLAYHVACHFKDAILRRRRELAAEPDISGCESIVINDLLVARPWRTVRSWQWKRSGHINVLETSTIVSLLSQLGYEEPDTKHVVLADSRVAKGALAKGRSSARALQPLCKRSAAVQVAGGLFPSFGFAPTRINTADNPSRFKELEEPVDFSFISHFPISQLQQLHAAKYSRWSANWLRLLILLVISQPCCAQANGFVLSQPLNLDCCLFFRSADLFGLIPVVSLSTLAFGLQCLFFVALLCHFWTLLSRKASGVWDHSFSHGWFFPSVVLILLLGSVDAMPLMPTTSADHVRAVGRAESVLIATRAVRKETVSGREKLLEDFRLWLLQEHHTELSTLLTQKPPDAEEVCRFLVLFGQEMFYAGRSYAKFSETINAISAARPILRRQLAGAWDLAFAWLADEPHQHHPALPLPILLASLTVSILWGWPRVAGVLGLTWAGICRIGEVLLATRADLVLPSDISPGSRFLLLRIKDPKTRGRCARHQASRVDYEDIVTLVSAVFRDLPRDHHLWHLSASTLRKRFSAIIGALGLPTTKVGEQRPFDLGSLRPGGATHLLYLCEDAELVRRRGRWVSAKTCEIYLQEVLVATYVNRLSDTARQNIERYAAGFPEVLAKAVRFIELGLPQKIWPFLFQQGGDTS